MTVLTVYSCYIENKKRRLLMERESLIKLPPSEDERQLIHKVFLKTIDPAAVSFKSRLLPPNTVWMENAKLKNMFICHPQVFKLLLFLRLVCN